MINNKRNKDYKKYKNYNKLDAIVKNQNVLKCIVNVLIFKSFVIKIVIVLDVLINNQIINIIKQF